MPRKSADVSARIIRDPNIMVGKPVVAGTRITVENILGYLADNPEIEELLAAYPRLTIEDVQACLAYAEEQVRRATKPKWEGNRPVI